MKIKTQYVCQNCGVSSPKWLGRCMSCSQWNTFVEEQVTKEKIELEQLDLGVTQKTLTLEEAFLQKEEHTQRISTGMGELDRVLGGGIVPDSFVLLGGDPGIGKSTIILQIIKSLTDKNILYVSGEESISQIQQRAKRIGVSPRDNVHIASETVLEKVFKIVSEIKPDVLILDSLQTFSTAMLESAPGSVGQVREVSAKLMHLAKSESIAVWLIGHVTKDGAIAGPKVVEHMVDTVLYFEGDSGQNYRLLRAVKNRFGSVRELGVFEMTSQGLMEVKNPSELFLNQRDKAVAGTAIAVSIEGTRPILVELQALVSQSHLPMPRRTPVGMEVARLGLLAAILERHMELALFDRDLFFNVTGGFKISEPACDLAAVAAIWSSFMNVTLDPTAVFIGELGLTGEVRPVPMIDTRIEEAKKLGFKKAVLSKMNQDRLKDEKSIELCFIEKVSDLSQFR